jgi:hypothetical protein
MIKMLIGAALVINLSVVGAAGASAEPTQTSPQPDPNPFAGLTCDCPHGTPGGDLREMERGMWAALSHP